MAGVFYLCWVPLPVIFGLWLYFSGRRNLYLHFAMVFLLTNLVGFTFYYIHPAAPPWYVALHGFEAVPGTPGSAAGLEAFDAMTVLGIFDALYARNSNVFAAMPSLHSAYTLTALLYALPRTRHFSCVAADARSGDARHLVDSRLHLTPLHTRCGRRHSMLHRRIPHI